MTIAKPEIKYLDNLPIAEEYLKQSSNPAMALKTKSCLNLSFISANAVDRLNNINRYNLKDLSKDALSFPSYKVLNFFLENQLIYLLTCSTITNYNNTQLSSHYERRKISIQNNKRLPSPNYCEDLMFSNNKTWGTMYGSLGYYIHLREDYEDYLTPSQLTLINSQKLIDDLKAELDLRIAFDNNPTYRELYNYYNSFNLEDSNQDIDIYLKIREIANVKVIRQSYEQLKFYQIWLPALINWYLKDYEEKGFLKEPTDIRPCLAFNLLKKVVQECISYSITADSIVDLPYQFMHQEIPPVFYGLFQSLSRIRKETSYNLQTGTNKTIEEKFADQFLTYIDINIEDNLIRNSSNILLQYLFPPGGLNMLLVTVAANLINRAYILTHSNNLANSDEELEIHPLEFRARINRLIFLAGNSLLKSSLTNLVMFGTYMIKVSGIDVEVNRKEIING